MVNSGAGTAYPSGAHEFTRGFIGLVLLDLYGLDIIIKCHYIHQETVVALCPPWDEVE
jgi:hypothetical protein